MSRAKEIVILKESEIQQAASGKEFLQGSSDNAHVIIDKAIVLKSLVNEILSNDELDRGKINEVVEEIIRPSYKVRGNADKILELVLINE